ncbi:MAG TPA: NUDIX domain-containing protein, partial [bacterium]
DLEMANSFPNDPAVICMIGVEHYDAASACCRSTVATITRREDEPELMRWFLEHLSQFRQRAADPKLLSFSGTDNDIPWLQERFTRYGLPQDQVAVMGGFQHIDLKLEFYRRTQNTNISLKKLEELFGIQREATITSKKVSYMLTDILSKEQSGIPEKIHGYLREDVHNLLVIFDQWEHISLDQLFFTEIEYLNLLASLLKLSRRLLGNGNGRTVHHKDRERLERFATELDTGLHAGLVGESFETFMLPKLPSLVSKGQDMDRLVKKYVNLKNIHIVDGNTKHYRLRRALHKPKGVLAVVKSKGKVLMIRRADGLARAPGYWGLPGGVLEKGEMPSHGAERELKEEVGLTGRSRQLLGTSPSVSREYELFWVEVEVDDVSTITPRPEEVAETRWVGPEELATLSPLIPGAIEGFQRFLGMDWGRRRRSSGR